MADKFPNLPGVVVNITDGNLTPDVVPAGPSVVVTGISGKGPSKSLTRVLGDGSSVRRFGLSGNLGRGLIEAMQGGSENTLAYRVLTTPGEIEVGAGFKITSAAEGSLAFEDLALRLDHGTGQLVVRDTVAGVTVYDSLAGTDLGIVLVSGAKAAGGVSIGKKVPISSAGEATGQTNADVAGDGATIIVAQADDALLQLNVLAQYAADGAPFPADLDIVIQVSYEKNGVDRTAEGKITQYASAGNPLMLTFTLAADFEDDARGKTDLEWRIIDRSDYESVYSFLTDRVRRDGSPDTLLDGSDANGLRLKDPNGATPDGLRYDDGATEASPAKMNYYEALIDSIAALETAQFDVFAPMGGNFDDPNVADLDQTLTALTVLGGAQVVPATCTDIAGTGREVNVADAAVGIPAAIGTSADYWITITQAKGAAFGLNSGEEVLRRTARILGAEQARDANGDAVAATTTLYLDRELSFSVDGDGVVGGAQTPTCQFYKTDLLMYYFTEEVDGAPAHKWYPASIDPDGNDMHEVNFGFRVAKFCHDMTENEDFTVGVIGTSAPTNSFDPAAISRWYGKSPVYETESPFGVVTNGKGLLGNKFLAGEVSGGVQFTPGLYDTPSGYLDDASVLRDSNDMPVDLGKFLAVVASSPIITNQADATGLGYIASGATLYAGMLASLEPWSSATGKTVALGSLRVPARLAKRHQNSLAGLGFTLFDTNSAGNVAVVDAPSAAMPSSDFRRNMTLRLLGEAVSRVRAVSSAFIGEPLSELRKSALETGIQRTLTQLQADSQGALESFGASISQSALEKATGFANLALSLTIVGELRRILVTVSLSL